MASTGGIIRTQQNAELAMAAYSNRMTGETEYVASVYTRAARSASAHLTRAELIRWRDLCNELLND